MKKSEALKQIDYLKELVSSAGLSVYESYPFLLLWGVVWMLGYTLTIWFDPYIWMILGGIGGVVSVVIGIKWPWKPNGDMRLLKKAYMQSLLIVVIFFFYPAFFVDGNLTAGAMFTFWPILIGVLYINFGILIGKEMVIMGLTVIIAAILGMYIPGVLQNLWFAFVCGGILIASGLFFRRKVK